MQPDKHLTELYEGLQKNMQKMQEFGKTKTEFVQNTHKLQSQNTENELVLSELEHLESDGQCYKLVGPALVSQDRDDAISVVKRRLEHIRAETKRIENLITQTEKEEDNQREVCVKNQQALQLHAQKLQQAQQQQQQQQSEESVK